MRLRDITNSDNLKYTEYLSRLSYTPKLYGVIVLPSYIQMYQNYNRFYTILFSRDIMIMAREMLKIFVNRVILASYNTFVTELNNDVLKIINDYAQIFTFIDNVK
jgi:hypothetical protein